MFIIECCNWWLSEPSLSPSSNHAVLPHFCSFRINQSYDVKVKMFIHVTFPACVAAVRHGWTPSNFPTVTMRGLILWFSFSVNMGTNMVPTVYPLSEVERKCIIAGPFRFQIVISGQQSMLSCTQTK